MSKNRIANTWWWGGWKGASAWPPLHFPSYCWLRQWTGEIDTSAGYKSRYTYISSTFLPQWGLYRTSFIHTMPCNYLLLSCLKYNLPPALTSFESEGCPSDPIQSPSSLGYRVDLTLPERPSRSARCNMGWWGGRRAYRWVWGPCWPVWRPFHIARCDKTWQGRPYWNLGHVVSWIKPCSRCSDGVGLEVWCCMRGIGNPSNPGPWALFHSLWTAQQISTPPILSVAEVTDFHWWNPPPPRLRELLPPPVPSGAISTPWRWSWVVCATRSGTQHGLLTLK